MDNFKLASQQKLRFQTKVGALSVEQLWDLTVTDLDYLAVELESEYNESGKKSFLVKRSVKDKAIKLRFDIVLDVLNTKVEEQQAAAEAKEIKDHNKKIIEMISDKKDENLKKKSVKELEALLK